NLNAWEAGKCVGEACCCQGNCLVVDAPYKSVELYMAAITETLEDLIHRYNVAAPRYTSYPTVPYWDARSWNFDLWMEHMRSQFEASSRQGISLYVHLPFCESLCTYCGCHTRITKNHNVEAPYIDALLSEWLLYRSYLGLLEIPSRELHLGGGTPTFFAPQQLQRLISGLLQGNRVPQDAAFSFEAHPANTTAEHLQV